MTQTTTKIIVLDDDPTGSQAVHGCLSLVRRSDSTLRGHYPVETDVIAPELGPFDAHFLVPAFFEGGRVTIDSTHCLMAEGRRDLRARLAALIGNACCVVDAERQADLDGFTGQVLEAVASGKRFLFPSGASLLTALARLPPQPVAPQDMGRHRRRQRPGAVIVGSHVKKTTAQLSALLREPGVAALEVDVDGGGKGFLAGTLDRAATAFASGLTAVMYTSRVERTFADQATRLVFGEQVSAGRGCPSQDFSS